MLLPFCLTSALCAKLSFLSIKTIMGPSTQLSFGSVPRFCFSGYRLALGQETCLNSDHVILFTKSSFAYWIKQTFSLACHPHACHCLIPPPSYHPCQYSFLIFMLSLESSKHLSKGTFSFFKIWLISPPLQLPLSLSFVLHLWTEFFHILLSIYGVSVQRVVSSSKMKVLVSQSCLTLCGPMDCSPPGFSILGILQGRILESVAIPFSKGSSWPRNQTPVPCIAGRFFTVWATREAL